MGLIRSISKTRCSLVACCVDTFTGTPPASSAIVVTIAGSNQEPIRKSDGMFVFTDLAEASCLLVITSPFYTAQSVFIDLDKLERNHPVVHIPLFPNITYPFAEHVTRLHARMTNQSGDPLSNLEISATPYASSAAVTRLAQEKAEAGDDQLYLGVATAKIAVGDRYRLTSKPGQYEEVCRINQITSGGRNVKLESPLHKSYQRGDLLFPVASAISNQKGEFIIPFRHDMAGVFPVRLTVRHENQELTREVEVESGKLNRLGEWRLK